MTAETAASSGVTEQSVEHVAASAAPAETTKPSSDLLAGVLREEGYSAAETQEIIQPKGAASAERGTRNAERSTEGDKDGNSNENEGAGGAGAHEKSGADTGGTETNAERGTRNAEVGTEGGEGGTGEGAAAAGKVEEEIAVSEEERKAWPPEALERIHKASAKSKERLTRAETAEAEAKQLREQLTASTATPPVWPVPTEDNPVAHVLDMAELNERVMVARDWRRFARANPDGKNDVPQKDPKTGQFKLDENGEVVTKDYPIEEIRKMLRESEDILEAAPNQARFIQARDAGTAIAQETYPEMFKSNPLAIDPTTKKPKNPEAHIRQTIWNLLPEIGTRLEDPDLFIGHMIRGLKAHEEEQAAKANGKNGKATNGKPVSEELKPFLQQTHVRQGPHVPGTVGSTGGSRVTSETDVEKASERVLAGDEGAELELVSALLKPRRTAKTALV